MQGAATGLFIVGPGGCGKSRTVAATLAEQGVKPILLNSHITPLALYQTLCRNPQAIIWLDDCDSIYGNLQVLGLLRSALWGQGDRVVTYTTTQLDGMPSRFVFTGRMILCANSIPSRNPAFKAVLSRCDTFTLAADREEVIEQMRTLASRGFEELTPDACLEVVDFLDRSAGSRPLSMRLFEPSLRKVMYAAVAGIDWRTLLLCQLDELGDEDAVAGEKTSRELDFEAMATAIERYPNEVKSQEQYWCEARQKARASFYRSRKAYQEHARTQPMHGTDKGNSHAS